MKISDNAEVVLQKRYYLNGEDWDGLCRRVANAIAKNPQDAQEYFEAINNLYFLPNSPTLMNSGTNLPNLSACFVLPLDDSMDSIMDCAKNMAIVFKSGGGVGIAMDNIRERDSVVGSTSGAASGVISFMELYDTVANVVKQGGRRRAATMISLRVDHPEILDFIDCKKDLKKFNNMNISVAVTDEFMKAAEQGLNYDLISPVNGIVGQLNAREVLEKIAQNAWENGEPGILFIDTINKLNPIPQFGKISTTNPCFRYDTLIKTKEYGDVAIGTMVGKTITIWNGFEWSTVKPRMTGKNQEMLKIVVAPRESGEFPLNSFSPFTGYNHITFLPFMFELNKKHDRTIYVTKYHKFFIGDNQFSDLDSRKSVEAQELKTGDRLLKFYENENTTKLTELIVKSIEPAGIEEEVYCFNEPLRHQIVANGILTGNCAEQPLLPNSVCNLGSINIDKIPQDKLDYYVRLGIRFLNDVIDAGKYPLPQIKDRVLETRQIGLGIMGWADYLARKMIPYDSQAGRNLAEKLTHDIFEIAHDESVMLAIQTEKYIDTTAGKRHNGTLLTVAPTGTISMIADCSSGIEPYFALAYTKNVMDGHSFKYINPILEEVLTKEGLWCSEVKAQIAKTGSMQNIDTIPQNIKDVFKVANEISVLGHVKMQASFQKYIDSSISKSINMKSTATVDDVLLAYLSAYRLGCKGLTVYRDGSRSGQVLTSPKAKIERCPECQSKEISHESGCVTCLSCGWSKCSI